MNEQFEIVVILEGIVETTGQSSFLYILFQITEVFCYQVDFVAIYII